jgi:hypothetical protein
MDRQANWLLSENRSDENCRSSIVSCVYPPCASMRRFDSFWGFWRLIFSIT